MTRRLTTSVLLCSLVWFGCSSGNGGSEATEASGASGASSAEQQLQALRDNVAATAARPELSADSMKVAHILVSFSGAERATVTRTKDEAEARAAELYARVVGGEDFLAVMKANSDDPGGGVYGMTGPGGAQKAGYFPRSGMAPAFGDTGWRLEVGEIGVAGYDEVKSPFGWHIIKRVE